MHNELLGTLLVFIAAAGAQAQLTGPRYWLQQGEGYPVCQDFLANLNPTIGIGLNLNDDDVRDRF